MSENEARKADIAKTYLVDVGAALTASFLVAPFMTVIDRSIIQNTAGVKPLKQGVIEGFTEYLTRPWRFFRRPEFFMIWGVYAATYGVANVVESTCIHKDVDVQLPKFIGTSIANMGAGIAKDRAFTRLFGLASPKALPTPTYFLFMTRDCLTIGASFNLPSIISGHLVREFQMDPGTAKTITQLTLPSAVQFFSTPLHLLALDLYNRGDATSGQRVALIKREYAKSVMARVGRIFPAFGVGGLGNMYFKSKFRELMFPK